MLDLTNQKFGMLTAIRKAEPLITKSGRKRVTWECLCDCGNTAVVTASNLKHHTQSCGCTKKSGNHRKTHGMAKSRIYSIWSGIKDRCLNANNHAYERYGGAGITICEEWKEFETFCKWAVKNGYSDNLTIDRKNNSDGYNPNNCRFVGLDVQSANRRKAHKKLSSKYIGVHFHKSSNKYAAVITVRGKSTHLGLFDSSEQAAKTRNEFIVKHRLPHTLNCV